LLFNEYLASKEIIIASEEVLREPEKQDNEVYRWVKAQPDMVVPIDGTQERWHARKSAEAPSRTPACPQKS
jgi:hypothetical protein